MNRLSGPLLSLLLALHSATALPQSTFDQLPDLGDSSGQVISPQQDIALGKAFMRQVRQSGLILDDQEVNSYLEALGSKLASHSENPGHSFTFFLVDDSTINAFAGPGGYIGVNVGLLPTKGLTLPLVSFGGNSLINVGNRTTAANLPITPSGSNTFKNPGVTSGGVNNTDVLRSAAVAAGVLSGAAPFGFMIARLVSAGVSADALINLLEQKGVARSLAEPNLVALSGDTASFLAGGEYPIPVSGQLGQVTVEYKKYGVGLAFTPTVLNRGLINLKIEPEVSQIDTTNQVAVSNNVSVPALIVRRASTTVELRDGQSFVIGGLLQTNNNHEIEQLPWLGSVPVLGTLFSSKSYQKRQTDLAIIVTPHIVRPTRPGDIVKSPTDNLLPPNDVDFFLLGKTEVTRAEARALTPRVARVAAAGEQPFTGHMLDLNTGGSNAAIQ